VIGTYVDHDRAIHLYGEMFDRAMIRPTTFAGTYAKYGRASRGRIRLLLDAYMQTMGERWAGENWDHIYKDLVIVCTDIIQIHGATLPTIVHSLGHDPVVPPWHWMALYQQNASSCRIAFKRQYARPFGN